MAKNNEVQEKRHIILQRTLEEDTQVVAEQTARFVNMTQPAYMLSLSDVSTLTYDNSAELLDVVTFFRIKSCSVQHAEQTEEYLLGKMTKFYTAIHALNRPIIYGVISYNGETNLVIGLILFFVYPLISSIWYAFNDVIINPGKIETQFKGLHWFKEILEKDPKYLDDVAASLGSIFYSLPVIIALSLILAVLLNQKFKGRTAFRVIFFLPIIMAGSVVMNQLNGGEFVTLPLFSSGEQGSGIIDYQTILGNLNMPGFLLDVLIFLLSNTIGLVWSCGVQTVLFLAGLQSIPDSFYEVSKIEGANAWEEFWRITVPSLRHIISLVLIYTMIDLFTDAKNQVVSSAYSLMVGQSFGKSSAMLWFYFAIVLVVIGAIYLLYDRYLVRKWE